MKLSRLFISPIRYQIEDFTRWKALKHPYKAGGQRALIERFCKQNRIKSVEQITEAQIAFFIGEELTQFYVQQALITFREFFRFCRYAGYPCLWYKQVNLANLMGIKAGRPMKKEKAARAFFLYNQPGMTVRKVAKEMSTEGEKIHPTSVFRWIKSYPQVKS